MAEVGVITARDLAQMDPVLVRRKWSVVLERTVRELNGQSCIALEDIPTEKKQIAVTRSFGAPVTEIGGLLAAVSEFAARGSFMCLPIPPLSGHPLSFHGRWWFP